MSGFKIIQSAKYTPENVVTNENMAKFVDTSDEWIYTRTGIKQRYLSKGENTSDICSAVARNLLDKSGTNALDIDLIIVATVTPDYAFPSTACLVQKSIGASNAFAFDISAACTGFIYTVSVAEKMLSGGAYKKVMVLGADVMSKIIDMTDRSICVLFGDGGGGLILEKCTGVYAEDLHSDGERSLSATGSYTSVEGDRKYARMNGREIYEFATKTVPGSIKRVLEIGECTLDDIKYIVPHQANARIIEVIAKKLKISLSRFYINIDRYANTTAGTIPIALAEMFENGILSQGSGDKIIITGFGGGLTWGSILIQI